MKYKIGELEVEAFQWKGDDLGQFKHLSPWLSGLGISIYREDYIVINGNIKNRYIEIHLREGDFLIMTHRSMFALSENEFNKIAVKVLEQWQKEPKFKVGDKVYYCNEYGFGWSKLKSKL